jgi:hypothetical protein
MALEASQVSDKTLPRKIGLARRGRGYVTVTGTVDWRRTAFPDMLRDLHRFISRNSARPSVSVVRIPKVVSKYGTTPDE